MSKPIQPEDVEQMMLTQAEKALILTVRGLPNGSYIEGLGIVTRTLEDKTIGQPGVVKGVTARCDLQNDESRAAILERGFQGMLPPDDMVR